MSAARHRLVVLGDALLDRDIEGTVERLAPDAPVPVLDEHGVLPRPGGAGLAAALLAADGHEVTLVCALGDDPAGRELRALLAEARVEVVDVGLAGTTPEKVRLRAEGRPLLRLDRGGGSPRTATAQARAAVGWADAVLVADYGRGMAALAEVREALTDAARRGAPIVWDPHPRGPRPVAGVTMATPNAAEARRFAHEARAPGADGDDAAAHAALLAERWQARQVCVTCGAQGAVLARVGDRAAVRVPAHPAGAGDPCGAGDRFASRAAAALAAGAAPLEAVREAVAAASAFVAAGGAGAFSAPRALDRGLGLGAGADGAAPADAAALADAVRAGGGSVVATGGCFDLLHPGHIQTLQAARALGDCLIVLLNSDASVRRLKGPSRPVVGQRDRASVLLALSCVDAVLVFDQDTPTAALEHVRPHVWVKGGDYAGRRLPESDALERWGGRVAVVPTLGDHSTTRLIEEAMNRAAV